MNVNGNIVLLGGGEIKNMRFDTLDQDPSSPTQGQMWINVTEQLFKGFDGTKIIVLGTAAIDLKITAINNAVGLSASSGFNPITNSNYINDSVSVMDAILKLDEAVSTNAGKVQSGLFVYDGAAAHIHTVTHNLGTKYHNVTIVDSTDQVILPESITYNSNTQLTVTFNVAIPCKVIVGGIKA